MEINELANEIWKPIRDYEGIYEVSNYGRVKSVSNEKYKKEKLRKFSVAKGYYSVILFKNGKRKAFSVHRLVAEAFIPNPHNLPQVNHKDENPKNNAVWNLEWCDEDYNIHYGTGIERRAKSQSHKVVQETTDGDFVQLYNSVQEAEAALGLSKRSHIDACCRGAIKTSNGFKWRYA